MAGNLIICTGPRAVGKTEFCKKLTPPDNKTLSVLTRDTFFESLFGKDVWNPYAGLMNVAEKRYALEIANQLRKKDLVFADAFMGSPEHLASFLKIIIEDIGFQPKIDVFMLHSSKDLCANQYSTREVSSNTTQLGIDLLRSSNNRDWDLFWKRFRDFEDEPLTYRDGTFEGQPINLGVHHICSSQKSFFPGFFQ